MNGGIRALWLVAAVGLALGCRDSAGLHGAAVPATNPGDSQAAGAGGTPARVRGPISEAEAIKPRPDLPPERRALLVTGAPGQAQERWAPMAAPTVMMAVRAKAGLLKSRRRACFTLCRTEGLSGKFE